MIRSVLYFPSALQEVLSKVVLLVEMLGREEQSSVVPGELVRTPSGPYKLVEAEHSRRDLTG